MYKISKFFENLLKTAFRIALLILLAMVVYIAFMMTTAEKENTETIEFVVAEKFEEDKGFVLLDKNIKTSGKEKMVRLDYITLNNNESNAFSISASEFDKLEVGKAYVGRFKNGELKYVQFDVVPTLKKEPEAKPKDKK